MSEGAGDDLNRLKIEIWKWNLVCVHKRGWILKTDKAYHIHVGEKQQCYHL